MGKLRWLTLYNYTYSLDRSILRLGQLTPKLCFTLNCNEEETLNFFQVHFKRNLKPSPFYTLPYLENSTANQTISLQCTSRHRSRICSKQAKAELRINQTCSTQNVTCDPLATDAQMYTPLHSTNYYKLYFCHTRAPGTLANSYLLIYSCNFTA